MFTVVTIFKKPYFTAINSRAQLCQSGRQSIIGLSASTCIRSFDVSIGFPTNLKFYHILSI